MDYRPEEWQIIRVEGTNPHYRVFGSWRGGFLDGDSWRLNSGIVRVEEDETQYHFYGNTGSVYSCHKETYGIRSPYNRGVMDKIAETNAFVMEEMPDIMNIEWDK